MSLDQSQSREQHQIRSYQEFWLFYLQEHSHPKNRALHLLGTAIVLVIVSVSFFSRDWAVLWALPVIGYGFAWLGHFLIEKNRPATFKYPFWSLISDFKMFFHFVSGSLASELSRAGVEDKK